MTDNTGVKSRETGHEAIQAAWLAADTLNNERPQSDGSIWIPVSAVEIDDSILPRFNMDRPHAEEFSHILDQLPPILVQTETLKLADGRHRVEGTWMASQVCIRAKFTDAQGDDLIDLAYELNKNTGLKLKLAERMKSAEYKMDRCPQWTNEQIASWAGLSLRHVLDVRNERHERASTYVDKTGVERSLPRQFNPPGVHGPVVNQERHLARHDDDIFDDLKEEPRAPTMTAFDNAQAIFSNDPGVMILGVDAMYLDALQERFNDIRHLSAKWCADGLAAIQNRRDAMTEAVEDQEYEEIASN